MKGPRARELNSPRKKVTDAEAIQLIESLGVTKAARQIGMLERTLHKRRKMIEGRIGRSINVPFARRSPIINHPYRLELSIPNGVVLIGSDAHYWPGKPTTAHRAFVNLCKELKPCAVIMNGDAFDGARISRHPPISWESQPSVQDQIEVTQERLHEIEKAAGRVRKIWPLGNHDARFETRLATVAPEYAKVHGVHLVDHFPQWEPCWSAWINGDTVVKHRFRSGVHATHNNTVNAGLNTVTSHLHSLKVAPFSDYRGTRYGCDTGCLADAYGPQFVDYSEDNPRNHRSGFIVLTFDGGRLLWPEVVHVIEEGAVEFRGKVIDV